MLDCVGEDVFTPQAGNPLRSSARARAEIRATTKQQGTFILKSEQVC
jgi:hypothetical protein